MMLAIRMVLYALFTTLANQGFEFYNPATGEISFTVEELSLVLSGALGFAATFVASRFSSVR